MDLGVKIHGFPKNHQVYPGLPRRIHWKGVISVVREAVLSVRRDARDASFSPGGLGGLAIRGFLRWLPRTSRMTMARGHSCRSRFEEFSAAIANWCSFMKFNPASYDIFIDVLFCQVQQVQWISELQIGAPDFNGCYMSRSPLQRSSKFPWSSRVVISGASLSWSTQHVLLKHHVLEFTHVFDICRGDSSWTPMSQCEEWEKCFYALNHHLSNSAMRILINSMYWRVSVRVSAVLRQRARGSGERGRQTELVNLLMDKASWLHGWASSTAVAQGCQLQRIYSFSYQIFAFDYAFLAGEMNWISAYVTIILSVRVGIVHSRRRNIGFLRKSCEFRLRHPFGKKHHFIF